MDDEIGSQERELLALKGTQVVAGSMVKTYQSTSPTYSLDLNYSNYFTNYKDVRFRMSAGYHYVKADAINVTEYFNGDTSTRINKERVTFSWWQFPQDGSGLITIRFFCTGSITYFDPSTVNFRITILGDEQGTFV